mgnify:CR=1 FL=1
MSAKTPAEFGKTLLMNQFKHLSKHCPDGFSIGLVDDNVYEWQVLMQGPEDTDYEGGYFPCRLSFTSDFPNSPPTMRFTTRGFWHPNVYPDGRVCISILHEAKEDPFNEAEQMSEKWRPIIGVEAILVSVQSMLSEPNFSSPANIDASVEMQKDPEAYRKRIRQLVRRTLEEL